MAKPSLMNLHILILILLNGHKISCPNNNLILKLYPNLKLFVKNIQSFQKEPEDKIGEPSPIRGNKFSHLSLGDETFAWESFEKKLSAYSFLKYLVQENDIHVDLPGL
jgi:hypothetical protein